MTWGLDNRSCKDVSFSEMCKHNLFAQPNIYSLWPLWLLMEQRSARLSVQPLFKKQAATQVKLLGYRFEYDLELLMDHILP